MLPTCYFPASLKPVYMNPIQIVIARKRCVYIYIYKIYRMIYIYIYEYIDIKSTLT